MATSFRLLPEYAVWHYTKAWSDLFRIERNVIWFLDNFFSISLLFRTLLTPFRRLEERGAGKSKLEDLLAKLIINTLMRLIGFCVRFATIAAGMAVILATIVFFLAFDVLWFFLPVVVLFLFFYGASQAVSPV